MFPQAIGMAAMFDEDMMQEIGAVVGTEARAKYNAYAAQEDRDIYKGLTLWSPNVNIFRDPRWGRGHETFGEDPYLSGRLGVGFIKGVQGDGEYLLAAACAKHFAVHSGPEESAMNLMPESARKTFGRHICLRLKHVWWRERWKASWAPITGRTGSHAAAVRL